MRILTWNINGVRTLPQYYPLVKLRHYNASKSVIFTEKARWNTLKVFDDILNHLEADIICFQEMKSSRQALTKQVALPSSFDSFFSFPIRKTGYSGTAIYTRRNTLVPLKAEEGLAGIIQPKPPLFSEERISKFDNYPPNIIDSEPRDYDDELDYKDLDSEGRAVMVDLGLFVLINVYCPNDGTGTEERDKFKMDYHRLLETRVDGLIKEGREVMVVGDLNACAAVEDHCEGRLMVERGLAEGLEGEDGFWGKDSRRWIRNWLIQEDAGSGKMVDIVRKLWPDRKAMYTCWNTKISARETNYGTRIDFILITPGLVPWVKAADIQPQIKGSDHCPVYVDFKDEIDNDDGTTTKLSDVLGPRSNTDEPAEPPRIAAKYWDEHKQKLLSNFFGKKGSEASPLPQQPKIERQLSSGSSSTPSSSSQIPISRQSSENQTTPVYPSESHEPPPPSVPKRKIVAESPKAPIKKLKTSSSTQQDTVKPKGKEQKATQSTLAGFFTKPKASTSKAKNSPQTSSSSSSSSSGPAKIRNTETSSIPATTTASPNNPISTIVVDDEDADYRFALALSQSSDNDMPGPTPSSQSQSQSQESKQAWNTLLAPTLAPVCTVHREPAKEFTVNKPGPNKGKKFFICSRPVGPGYDKGRSERPREQVDPQWKCDFFKWSSDVRKEMSRNGS